MNKNILIEFLFVIGKIWIKKKTQKNLTVKGRRLVKYIRLLLYNMKHFKLVHCVASSLSIFLDREECSQNSVRKKG